MYRCSTAEVFEVTRQQCDYCLRRGVEMSTRLDELPELLRRNLPRGPRPPVSAGSRISIDMISYSRNSSRVHHILSQEGTATIYTTFALPSTCMRLIAAASCDLRLYVSGCRGRKERQRQQRRAQSQEEHQGGSAHMVRQMGGGYGCLQGRRSRRQIKEPQWSV